MITPDKTSRAARRKREALAKKGLYQATDVSALLVEQREGLKREDFLMRLLSALLQQGVSLDVPIESLQIYQRVVFETRDGRCRAHLGEKPVRPPPSEATVVAEMLKHAGREISVEIVAGWKPEDQRLAEDWACSSYLAKTDPSVPVPPEPEFVKNA